MHGHSAAIGLFRHIFFADKGGILITPEMILSCAGRCIARLNIASFKLRFHKVDLTLPEWENH